MITDITAVVIGVIISLLTIVGFFIKIIQNQNVKTTEQIVAQTKISIQLATIQKELLEMKQMMSKKDKEIEELKKRINEVENQIREIKMNCKMIQNNKK